MAIATCVTSVTEPGTGRTSVRTRRRAVGSRGVYVAVKLDSTAVRAETRETHEKHETPKHRDRTDTAITIAVADHVSACDWREG